MHTDQDVDTLFRSYWGRNRSRLELLFPSEDDFAQDCWVKYLQSTYDPERGAISTFCYLIADSLRKRVWTDRHRQKAEPLHQVEFNEAYMKGVTRQDHSNLILEEYCSRLRGFTLGNVKFPAETYYTLRAHEWTYEQIAELVNKKYGTKMTKVAMAKWNRIVMRKLNLTKASYI